MQCMIIYFKKNSKTPKILKKPPKPRSKMHECMKKEGFRTLTKWFDLGRGRKCSGWEDFRVRKSFGSREKVFYRERREKWKPNHASKIYGKTQLNGSRSYRDLSSTKSRQKWICQGVVEDLSMAKIPRWIEKLSRIYWPDRKFLDGSRSCRETIETNSKKLDGLKLR